MEFAVSGREAGAQRDLESEADGEHRGKTLKAMQLEARIPKQKWDSLSFNHGITNLGRSLVPIKPKRSLKCQ